MELVKIQIPLNRNPEKISELSHKSKIRLKWLILCAPCPQLSMICFSNSDPDGRKSKARYSFIYYCLLLLSCFSCVQLCATPETAAHQAPPSLGLSRQERWSGLPIPSPILFLTICHLTRNGSSTTRSHAWGQMTIQAMQVASLLLNINKSNHFSPWHYHIYYTTYFTYLIC